MMHTLNEVLLEQNEKSHAELLSNYQAILEENFNRWCEYSTKKSNAIVSAINTRPIPGKLYSAD